MKACGGEMTRRWKQMISVACLTKHIRGVWQSFSRGFGKWNSDGCCLHTWLAGRLSGNQGHRLVMWHHIVFRVKPTVLNVILFIMFQRSIFHTWDGYFSFIRLTLISGKMTTGLSPDFFSQSVSHSKLQAKPLVAKTSVGVEIIFSPVFSSFGWNVEFYLPAENFLSLFLCRVAADAWKGKKKIKGSLIGRSQHLDGGVVSTLCVLEQSEKELKDGIESKIILRKHCLKTKGTFK